MAEDWEDVNKRCFVQLVQTYLLKSEANPDRCVRILFEAMRCKKGTIPEDLDKASRKFIDWQLHLETVDKPEWVTYCIGPGIP